MANRKKYNKRGMPAEKHDTAGWANIESKKNHSEVTVPSEFQVLNAKLHVDENEK
jgi:hypothetical protein